MIKKIRPSVDEWALGLATAVAARADCTRRQVGCVIMAVDRTIIATGYNGAPSGEPGCLTAGACPRGRASQEEVPGYDSQAVRNGTAAPSSYDIGPGSCIALHDAQNALMRADWEQMKGGTFYGTHEPCGGCWRMIKGSPLHRAVWPDGEWNRSVAQHKKEKTSWLKRRLALNPK